MVGGETRQSAPTSDPEPNYRNDLLVAVGDASSGEIIRSELDLDFVTGKNTDVVAPHLSGDMAQDIVTILELDPEHGVRE